MQITTLKNNNLLLGLKSSPRTEFSRKIQPYFSGLSPEPLEQGMFDKHEEEEEEEAVGEVDYTQTYRTLALVGMPQFLINVIETLPQTHIPSALKMLIAAVSIVVGLSINILEGDAGNNESEQRQNEV